MPWCAARLRRIFHAQTIWGWGMSVLADTIDHETLHDAEQLKHRLAVYQLQTSDGMPHRGRRASQKEACWVVVLSTDGDQIRRDIWIDHNAWKADRAVAARGNDLANLADPPCR